jgi:tRNA uridine 5-carboxymethylaminomethyl modification enzyme
MKRDAPASSLLRRPEIGYADLAALECIGPSDALLAMTDEEREQATRSLEIEARYAGYIARQSREIERSRSAEATALPLDLDYAVVQGLSNEIREKLARIRPQTIGQASRVAGMTPAGISLLLVHLKRHGRILRSA